jgi:hypothetical protein
MAEIPATKTPRILAAMENLSTLSVTHLGLLCFEQGGKVLTVCARAKRLVWRGFWRVSGVEKTEEGFGKKGALSRGTKAKTAGCVNLAASFPHTPHPPLDGLRKSRVASGHRLSEAVNRSA